MKIVMPNSKDCFYCGTDNPIGMHLTYYLDENRISTDFIPDKKYGFSEQLLNTGIAFGILVEAMGWVPAYSLGNPEVLLIDFSSKVLMPIPIGHKVSVIAEAISINGWISEIQGIIRDEIGNICIKATGKFIVKNSTDLSLSGHSTD